jgi:hypothetical protein
MVQLSRNDVRITFEGPFRFLMVQPFQNQTNFWKFFCQVKILNGKARWPTILSWFGMYPDFESTVFGSPLYFKSKLHGSIFLWFFPSSRQQFINSVDLNLEPSNYICACWIVQYIFRCVVQALNHGLEIEKVSDRCSDILLDKYFGTEKPVNVKWLQHDCIIQYPNLFGAFWIR